MRAVNLIPSDERRGGVVSGIGTGRSQGAAYGVLTLLAGLSLLALVYGLARHQVSNHSAQLATIAARTSQLQHSTSALSSYTSFIALREQRVQAVDQLVDSRFDWAHALHELGRVLPHGASITAFNGAIATTTPGAAATAAAAPSATSAASSTGTGAAAVTSATPPGSVPTMTLAGCATSQAEVAVTLLRLRLIDGVTKVALQSSTKTSGAVAGGGAGSSPCGGGPSFSAELTFDALPTAPIADKSAAQLTSPTGAGR
jgi:Tfp pilus assembly protein PilN